MAMLGALTDYNRAIAEYVLTVLPPATPANRLSRRLWSSHETAADRAAAGRPAGAAGPAWPGSPTMPIGR